MKKKRRAADAAFILPHHRALAAIYSLYYFWTVPIMRNELFYLRVNLLLYGFLLNIFQLKLFSQAKINGPDISNEDARCYLNNYPELKSNFGENLEAVKNHWHTYGLREERVKDCAPLQKYNRQFVKSVSSSIYFVSDGLLYHATSCKPCGQSKSLCDGGIPVIIIDRKYLLGSKIQSKIFDCASQCPEAWEGYTHAMHRIPLKIVVTITEPPRVNILMTGIGRDFTGGPLSIMHFANELMSNGFHVRWINVDGVGLQQSEFKEHAKKYNFLSVFSQNIEFVYDATNYLTAPIRCNPSDMFMATLYFTAQIAHFTIKAYPLLQQQNFVYFIQDFEPIFFPHDSNHMEALESYRFPHFAIYSTPFLQRWFQAAKYGQYEFMLKSKRVFFDISFAAKPAIKKYQDLDATQLTKPGRKRTLISYLRNHADRNAYSLTLDALSAAVCANVFDNSWQFIGVGALSDYNISIGYQCGNLRKVSIKQNIPEPEYQRLVATGDVGFSLMISPHPSLPPFDFAAAGLVTVTNSFRTKTAALFDAISTNFIVVKPFIENIVEGLRTAVERSSDVEARQKGQANFNWERDWTGPECYGQPLIALVKKWQTMHKPLWSFETSSQN